MSGLRLAVAVEQALDARASFSETTVVPSRRRFAVRRLVLQEVALVGLLAHDLAAAGHLESLRGALGSLPLAWVLLFIQPGLGLESSAPRCDGTGKWSVFGGYSDSAGLGSAFAPRPESLCSLGAGLGSLLQGQDHRHVARPPFAEVSTKLPLGDIGAESLQQPVTEFGTRLLASAGT